MLLHSKGKANKVRENSKGYLVCGVEVCFHILNFIVTGHYTIVLLGSNQSVQSFLNHTVSF